MLCTWELWKLGLFLVINCHKCGVYIPGNVCTVFDLSRTWVMVTKDDFSHGFAHQLSHPQNALNVAVFLHTWNVHRSTTHSAIGQPEAALTTSLMRSSWWPGNRRVILSRNLDSCKGSMLWPGYWHCRWTEIFGILTGCVITPHWVDDFTGVITQSNQPFLSGVVYLQGTPGRTQLLTCYSCLVGRTTLWTRTWDDMSTSCLQNVFQMPSLT